METWIVILINGVISSLISSLAYYGAIKKNRVDFINNQISIIEAEIDSIKDITYEIFIEIFQNNKSLDDILLYRQLAQKTDSLHNKILTLDDFKQFTQDVVEYNIFSTNAIEAEDKKIASAHLNSFDELYSAFKQKLYQHQNDKNT